MRFKVYRNDRFKDHFGPDQDNGMPDFHITRQTLKYILLIIGLILLAAALITGFHLLTEYVWMDSLGFAGVFTTLFTARLLLFASGFLLFALTLFTALYGIRIVYKQAIDARKLPQIFERHKIFLWINLVLSAAFGVIGSSFIQGLGWERFLTYFHRQPFQVSDPLFGQDVSFYVYTLPFWKFILSLLLVLFIIVFIIQLLAFSVFQIYLRQKAAKVQLTITALLIGGVLAVQHFLSRYDTLLTDRVNAGQRSVVHGASYTDQIINIPMAYIMAVVSLSAAVLFLVGLYKKKFTTLLLAPALYIGMLVVGQGAAYIVQSFIVTPNEFARETPYLPHNMEYTREAYGLNDVTETDHPGALTLDADMIERNALTIDNVRVNDARPLLDVYNQMQTVRTYYEFNDVDVDRYVIDGEYNQVFIGARELNTDNLSQQAQTWTNRTLRYTHGYGVAMSHVNQTTAQGSPEFIVENIPPEGDIEITRPQVYFGEQDYDNVIVNTHVAEFDYPGDNENVSHQFEEDTGIDMTRWNRLLYALEEMSPRMFISDQMHSDSQFLRKRNIQERVHSIAPFLSYDHDPYIVVRDDGTLVWIIDAYTTTGQYPYSEAVEPGVNYIQNSVKVVVDAYTGEVDFFVVEEDDPLLKTYQSMFPDLFTTDIPEDIRDHFRYPLRLFTYQADMYRTYHMSDLEVFYNREDYWQFPRENYYESDHIVEPYYITMQLEDEDSEEFILKMPFTPNNRQNMIAWMAARNDGENYGELLVYRFPRDRTIYGPQQIENRIDQDPYISQQLSLWERGGSRVIRGNLLVIPIEDTLMYVEPVYIESDNQTALPEVKQIIIAYDDYIVMEDNFENALTTLLGLIEEGVPAEDVQDGAPGVPALGSAEEFIEEITELFEQYQNAMSAGNWEEAGQIMTQLESHIEDWSQQQDPEQDPEQTPEDQQVQPEQDQDEQDQQDE